MLAQRALEENAPHAAHSPPGAYVRAVAECAATRDPRMPDRKTQEQAQRKEPP